MILKRRNRKSIYAAFYLIICAIVIAEKRVLSLGDTAGTGTGALGG